MKKLNKEAKSESSSKKVIHFEKNQLSETQQKMRRNFIIILIVLVTILIIDYMYLIRSSINRNWYGFVFGVLISFIVGYYLLITIVGIAFPNDAENASYIMTLDIVRSITYIACPAHIYVCTINSSHIISAVPTAIIMVISIIWVIPALKRKR